jgi:hypothetical protein
MSTGSTSAPHAAERTPAASLINIGIRGKTHSAAGKSGDLTRQLSALAPPRAEPVPPPPSVPEPPPALEPMASPPPAEEPRFEAAHDAEVALLERNPPAEEFGPASADDEPPHEPPPPVAPPPALAVHEPIEIEPPALAVHEPTEIEPPAAPPLRTPPTRDMTAYWRYLCRDRDFPPAEALDREFVAQHWPGTLVIAFAQNSGETRREPSLARVTRLGAATADATGAVDYGPSASEWMLELGRAALMAGAPVEEMQRLPTGAGATGFRLVALPLGSGDAPDSVLCSLAASTAAPRFGKRRTWLER